METRSGIVKRFKNKYVSMIVLQIFMLYALFVCVSSGYLYYQYRDDINSYDQIEEKNKQSELLILSKKTDQKVIENSGKYQMDYDNFNDYISDEEFNRIKKINGIKEIKSYYNIYLSDKDFQIYEDNECIEDIRNEILIDDQKVKGNIYLVGYDSFQAIKHHGKEIDGVYLNHQFKQLLDHDIVGKTIKITSNIPSSMQYNENYEIRKMNQTKETLKGYDIQTVQQDLSFQINGILEEDEYNTAVFDRELVIYAPTSMVEDILTMFRQKPNSYQTRKYKIYCQSSKKEYIKKEIQKMSSLYTLDDEFKNIYVGDNGSLMNCMISCVIVIVSMISYLMVMNHKIKNKRDLKELLNRTSIIALNITMLMIFVMTQSFYYIALWILPAILVIALEYIIMKKVVESS